MIELREGEYTVGELVRVHANALLVGASGGGKIVIVGAPLLVGPDGPNGLDRDVVANLVAWLIMVGGLKRDELDPVFDANGVPAPWASEKV